MATPNKNYSTNATSPQYPSQEADFISLENGGPHRNNFKIQQSYKGRDSHSRPYQMNNRQSFNNSRNSFDFRDKKKNFNNSKNLEYNFAMYFHPSMLQDPWENLMKRYESLSSSRISIKETQDE